MAKIPGPGPALGEWWTAAWLATKWSLTALLSVSFSLQDSIHILQTQCNRESEEVRYQW